MNGKDPYIYPQQAVHVHKYAGSLADLLPSPNGELQRWPLIQVTYLEKYLLQLECNTIIEEEHYIDRDYIEELALFYSRSLRNYSNYCRRLHFFSEHISQSKWQDHLQSARQNYDETCATLNRSYLGFIVIRPLPGRPIGRTVLKSLGPKSRDNHFRDFAPLRRYTIHLSGLTFDVEGLAFQQQDQGVSACATTAIWTALHSTAQREYLKVPTPAEITQAACRYLLMNGRTLPSEGLAVQQICEAVRDSELAPVLLPASSLTADRRALDIYIRSGFAAVLAVMPINHVAGSAGHALCAVGAKVGTIDPQTDPELAYRDGATELKGLYVHDDRLGPYAVAQLQPLTVSGRDKPQTSLLIKWPGTVPVEEEYFRLYGIVIPVPNKIRLSAARMREAAHIIGQSLSTAIPAFERTTTIRCRYIKVVDYHKGLFKSKISDSGLSQLVNTLALSRYIGVIQVTVFDDEPLADILLDCTEAVEHPSVIAVVSKSDISAAGLSVLEKLATTLSGKFFK